MDTKKLRQKILDLAIHGKLVPQDPNDEPASVLLERIRAEKEQLIKEGKIKAPKKSKSAGDTSHYPKEVPFEVPKGWVWCSFPAVAELISGQDFPPEKYNSSAKGIPYIIGASNIEDGHLRISRWTEYPSVLSQKGDVLVVCKGAGVGKVAVNDIGTVHIARQIQAVRIQDEIVSSDFMRILIDWCVPSIVTQANGLIPGLKRELLLNVLLPIPPRNEQDLIVSTLCGAFDIIKGMEVEHFKLEDDIRKSRERVLELAISGKLVPQDPSEEPAIELLRRINPGFIPSHNLHYGERLPNGWTCGLFGDLNQHRNKSEDPLASPNEEYELYSVPFYETGMPEFLHGKEIGSTKQIVDKGDVLLCKINPHLNRSWVVSHYRPELKCIASSEWLIFANEAVLPGFARLFFISPQFKELMLSNVSGVGGSLMRARASAVNNYPIWIPPINEQKRIVKAVYQLYDAVDSLASNLD